MRAWLQEKKIDADVVEVGCIGLCAAEPILDVQLPGRARVSFESVTEKNAINLLETVMAGVIPDGGCLGQFRPANGQQAWDDIPCLDEHPFFKPQRRWVLANCGLIDPARIDEYIARGGYAPFTRVISHNTPEEICEMVEKSGLRGRGGGGFPTGRKWKFALGAVSDKKYLVCNADEGDPGAFMDRSVLEGDPHCVLEGHRPLPAMPSAPRPGLYLRIRAEYPRGRWSASSIAIGTGPGSSTACWGTTSLGTRASAFDMLSCKPGCRRLCLRRGKQP